MKLSIIIPVYNVKAYLSQCLDSLLNEDYRDYQIVIIDDGSTDGSEKICDEYSKKFSDIKVIHKKNEGPAIARNIGIQYAEGEYIVFLDSDDMIVSGGLKKISNMIDEKKDADVYVGQIHKILFPRGRIENREQWISFDEKENNILSNMIKYAPISLTYIWRNVYRTKFLKENDIYFQEHILCGEDVDWNTKVFLKAKLIDFIDFPFYIYRGNRKGSIVTEVSFNRVYDFYIIVEKWITYSNQIENLELRKLVNEFYAMGFFSSLKYIYNYNIDERKRIIEKIENGQFWRFPTTKKDKKILKIKQMLGLNFTLRLLNLKYRSFICLKKAAIKMKIIDR